MTELLDKAVEMARVLPPEQQDDIARSMLADADRGEPMIELTPGEEADLIAAQLEMERQEFASEAEAESVLSRYRLETALRKACSTAGH